MGYNEDGTIKYIMVSSSLIKKFFWNSDEEIICPRKMYHTSIMNDHVITPSLSMKNGLYFESMVLGSGRGQKLLDLPRKRNGDKTADHLRIDEQVHLFDKVVTDHQMIVIKNNENIQVDKKFVYEPLDRQNFNHDVTIIISGVYDLISPIFNEGVYFKEAVIDIKLAKDREGGFGRFHWGNVKSLDHTQPILYSFTSGLPSFYLLFDYKPNDRGYRIIPVLTEQYLHALEVKPKSYDGLLNEAKLRTRELQTIIVRTAELMIKYEVERWPVNPCNNFCKNCPVSEKHGGYCKDHNETDLV